MAENLVSKFTVNSQGTDIDVKIKDADARNLIAQEISDRNSAITTITNNLNKEISDRENADTTITNNLNTALDERITQETAARENADTDLENKIKSLDFIPSNEVYNDILIAEFHNEDDGKAEFYTSVDGYNFNKIPTNFKINGRDGSLVFLNNTFYLACTWFSDNLVDYQFVIYTSIDFVNWIPHTVKVNNATGSTWAPDLYVNGNTLEVYFTQESVYHSGIFQAYKCTCTDINTLTFSAPVKINGTPNNVIDVHRFDFNGPRVILKDETTKKVIIYTLNDTTLTNPIDVTSFTFPVEGPTTAIMGGYLYIMCDRFLDYNIHKYWKQTPVVTRTADLINFEKVVECHTNKKWAGYNDFSRSRHGCYYKPSTKALEIIKANYEIMAASNYEIENSSIEHINIEDIDSTNWTLFPNTIYCVFNNPTGATTPTTNITISEPHNPYELDHYDLFLECDPGKVINIKSRNNTYSITSTAQNWQTCLHFIRGIDGYFALVGPHD